MRKIRKASEVRHSKTRAGTVMRTACSGDAGEVEAAVMEVAGEQIAT
jgi:hypothetical protein